MRNIRNQALLFSVFLLCGLIIGCATPLADPTGPNSSLVIGRVVINSQYLSRAPGGSAFPLGTIQDEIKVEIESEDESQFITATTAEGYFMLPNISPNTFNLSGVTFGGQDGIGIAWMDITFRKKPFFTSVPGEILYLGTVSLEISENKRVTVKYSHPNPEEAKSHLLKRYPGTPWLARQFRNAQWQR